MGKAYKIPILLVHAAHSDKEEIAGGRWTLTGLKIIGDANVPAQKVSFEVYVDLSLPQPCVQEWAGESETQHSSSMAPPPLACLQQVRM